MYKDYLETYLKYKFAVIPVKEKSKATFIAGWQQRTLEIDVIRQHYELNPNYNIAVVTGSASGNIIDIDLDSENAILAGNLILPPTDLVFGRGSRPVSHYVYRVDKLGQSASYQNPISKVMDVELRGDGHYTVFPGSVHPSGELIEFTSQGFGEPSLCEFDVLSKATKDIATVCVLAELWINGSRHETCLAFCGWCAKNNVKHESCEHIVRLVCQITNDEEFADRMRCVSDTYHRHSNNMLVSQRSRETAVFSPPILTCLSKLMDVKSSLPVSTQAQRAIGLEGLDSETAFTKKFVSWLSGKVIFSVDDNCFYCNKYDVFTKISSYDVSGLVILFLEEMAKGDLTYQDRKSLSALSSNAKVNAVVNLTRIILRTDSKHFDSDRYLVGCRNGVLDLRSGFLVEPQTIVSHRINTHFNPKAKCPNFEKFVDQIMGGDADMIAYLQRALGYSLSGLNDAQCMFVGIGRGANGKSTLLNVMQELFGEYTVSTPMHTLMVSKFGGDRTDDLAKMQHKRLVSAQEGEANQSLAVAKIKQMTGGDRISCRLLYGNLFEYEPKFKLWLFTNELPKVPGGDTALWRRLHIINFGVTIPVADRNPKLGETLATELPGILNWLVDGYRDYSENGGLRPPQRVLNATKAYQQESDVVALFVESACDRVDDRTFTMTSNLYVAYIRWCQNSGLEPIANSMFGKELQRLGFEKKSSNKGTMRRGIILKDDEVF